MRQKKLKMAITTEALVKSMFPSDHHINSMPLLQIWHQSMRNSNADLTVLILLKRSKNWRSYSTIIRDGSKSIKTNPIWKKKVCTALHRNFTVEMNILYYYLNWACLATAVGNKRPVQTSYWLVETVTGLVTAENRKRPVCVGPVRSFPRLGISRTGYGYGLRHSRPKDRTGPDFQTLTIVLIVTISSVLPSLLWLSLCTPYPLYLYYVY